MLLIFLLFLPLALYLVYGHEVLGVFCSLRNKERSLLLLLNCCMQIVLLVITQPTLFIYSPNSIVDIVQGLSSFFQFIRQFVGEMLLTACVLFLTGLLMTAKIIM